MHQLIQRYSFIAILAISGMLLGACGRMDATARRANGPMMSEVEALETLQSLPVEDSSDSSGASQQSFLDAVQQAAAQQQGKMAASEPVDLTQLQNLLTLMSNGQGNNLLSLANGLVSMNGGSTTGTSTGLSKILNLLTTLAPIIAVAFPQFAPIVTAITTILPLVITFIGLFKKKPAPSAWLMPVGLVKA